MYGFLLALHILVCFALVAVVLVQSGKGGGLAGGAFGGSAQTVFGGRGATDFMTRATMVLGGAFFLTSLVLSLMTANGGRSTRSLIQEEARHAPASAPVVPGATPSGAPSGAPAGGGSAPPGGTPPSGGGASGGGP